jgi:DNA polymerase-3 subunit epsilon
MKINRPLVVFDIEATGLDVCLDRIVSIAMLKLRSKTDREWLELMINPEREMSEEVIAIHGITNEQVKGCPPFKDVAEDIWKFITGCDLIGYNLLNFDVQMLWEEFYRLNWEWKARWNSNYRCRQHFQKEGA